MVKAHKYMPWCPLRDNVEAFMKHKNAHLEIRVYEVDGSRRTFEQNDHDLVRNTLNDLQPAALFTKDRIMIASKASQNFFLPAVLTRIDLITDLLAAWDFPTIAGVFMELTEDEFFEGLDDLGRRKRRHESSEKRLFLDLEMLDGQRLFLSTHLVDHLPAADLGKIYSLLKEGRLIFGLRTGGVGVLNLANVWRFSVRPEPPEAADVHDLPGIEISQRILN